MWNGASLQVAVIYGVEIVSKNEKRTVIFYNNTNNDVVWVTAVRLRSAVCVCVCVSSSYLFWTCQAACGCTSRGDTGGRSHRISQPSFFCGVCLNFSSQEGFSRSFPSSTVNKVDFFCVVDNHSMFRMSTACFNNIII